MRVGVIGLGNILMGDDAFGPHVVQALLAGHEFGSAVTVLDLGTPGLDLTPHLAELDALVIADTVRSDGAAGEIRTYRRAEILKHPPQPRLSPHDPGLKEALLIAEFAGGGPREVLLVGAIPGSTAMGVGLSEALRAAVPVAVERVLAELDRLGAKHWPRARPATPDLWWERAPAIAGP